MRHHNSGILRGQRNEQKRILDQILNTTDRIVMATRPKVLLFLANFEDNRTRYLFKMTLLLNSHFCSTHEDPYFKTIYFQENFFSQ